MTVQELQKRSERAQGLKVWQLEESNWFYCESEEGKICYKVCYVNDTEYFCTCGDFAKNYKSDSTFKCKHVLAVSQCVPNGEFEKSNFLEKRKPKLNEKFIIQIEGKEFVQYAGLLDLAHQKGLLKIEVEPLQFPTKENDHFAICKAIVLSKSGEIYSDVGDGNPQNCNSKVARHLLRMSSTRAIGRALRSMTNIGMTCLEELGDMNEVITDEKKPVQQKKDNVKPFPKAQSKKEEHKPAEVKDSVQSDTNKDEKVKSSEAQTGKTRKAKSGNGNGKNKTESIPMMSEAQKSAVYNLSRRRGISVEELEKMCHEKFGVSVEELSSVNAASFIRNLQQSA